jgi:hypothetical protein
MTMRATHPGPAAPRIEPQPASDPGERAFDLLRGVAAYTRSPLVAALAHTVARWPEARLDIAFNHKQVASKTWARDRLHETLGGRFASVWVMGGWYGVMAALLFDDPRFEIGSVTSVDLDPEVAAVAETLNAAETSAGRFRALTGDMYAAEYGQGHPGLVINTSCEHIGDLAGWLARLPEGTPVLLQSNDYAAEPSHISTVRSEDEFAANAGLSAVLYAGCLPMKRYTRFMLIGRR